MSKREFFVDFAESSRIFLKPELFQIKAWTKDPAIVAVVKNYESGSDFFEKNPDCCSYGRQASTNPDGKLAPPSIVERFFGYAWGQVAVRVRTDYIKADGSTGTFTTYTQYWADSCGNYVE